MTGHRNCYCAARPDWFALVGALALTAAFAPAAAAVQDVLLQTVGGKIVTGIVDDQNFLGSLGGRIHRGNFLTNFRSANPGFVALATGNANMPPGAAGFPSNHDVSFDFVPMTISPLASNLLYWDGSDANGNGLDLADVAFIRPTGTRWEMFDANFNVFAATGTDALVPGGLIDRTSADIDPSDGIDTGAIHRHLVLQLVHDDAGGGALPPHGVYMIALQARSTGFETSVPFVFVHRTSDILLDPARDLAADWVLEHLEARGDYNHNGVVDAADYTVWRDHLGTAGGVPGTIAGDGTGDNLDGVPDGDVDQFDYELWLANFGHVGLFASRNSMFGDVSAAAIIANTTPEPATLWVAAVALAVGALSRKRQRYLRCRSRQTCSFTSPPTVP
jgi:hypothetical protein